MNGWAPIWSPHDLREATGGTLATLFAASGVSIDTRTIQPGDLFVALQGEAGDGHAFVADALAKGAAGAVVHHAIPDADPLLCVDDTLAALHRLGGYARQRFTGRLVAVTGSVGKTTTKEMLRTVLSAFGRTHAAVASYNNHWGLPLTLARLPLDAEYCVAEIGMNHAGEIAPLARLARAHVAVITAVEKAHIGYLGSIEAIADEKAEILRPLEPDGVAVLPADLPLLARLCGAAGRARVVTFGAAPEADARLVDVAMDAEGSDVTAAIEGVRIGFRLAAPGRHMAMNALAALAAARHLTGADPEPLAAALQDFAPVVGRGARRRIAVSGGAALLLDESYNGNPASMRAALAILRLQPARRRIAVLGDMLELGEAGADEHRTLAAEAAAAADGVFACGPLMKDLYAELPVELRIAYMPDSAALAPLVARAVAPGDAVLIKGSLGSKMKLIVNALEPRAEAA